LNAVTFFFKEGLREMASWSIVSYSSVREGRAGEEESRKKGGGA
jgi:hypothetical protein